MSERTLARVADPRLIRWVEAVTEGYDSVIEYGCGRGLYLPFALCGVKVGIEAFEPYVREAQDSGVNVVLGDMRNAAGSDADVGLFIDSLEHISKEDGLALLRKIQAEHKKIAIFAPLGFYENGPCDKNEMQRHLSAWTEADLEPLGFKVTPLIDYHHGNTPGQCDAFFAEWVRP